MLYRSRQLSKLAEGSDLEWLKAFKKEITGKLNISLHFLLKKLQKVNDLC